MALSSVLLCCLSVISGVVLKRPANVYPPEFANTLAGWRPRGPSSLLQEDPKTVGPGVSASINATGLTFQEVNKTRYCHELHNMRLADVPPAIPLNNTIKPRLDWESCLKLCHAEPACLQVVYDQLSSTCYPMGNFTLVEYPGDYDETLFNSARCGDSKVMDHILKQLDDQAQAENNTEHVENKTNSTQESQSKTNFHAHVTQNGLVIPGVHAHAAKNQLAALRPSHL